MKRGAAAISLATLGALFVPSWPIQLVCYFGLAVTVLSALYSRVLRHAIRAERDSLELKAHAHATVRVGITIRNASPLPAACVAVRDRQGSLRALTPAEALVSLAPQGSARLEYSLQTLGRGVHDVGPLAVTSADPLGLFPWERSVGCPCHVTVFPPLGTIRRRIGAGLPGGEIRVPDIAYEDPSRFRAVREYVPGDDTRRIHWKISARLGSLYTLEYEHALTAPCLVLLDLCLERFERRYRHHFVERAVEAAASLVAAATDGRQSTALCSTGHVDGTEPVIGFGRGPVHAACLLEVLARIAPVAKLRDPVELLLGSGLRIRPGTRLCIVGPPPSPGVLEGARDTFARVATLEVYEVGSGDPHRSATAPKGVRLYAVEPHGEELAGDP